MKKYRILACLLALAMALSLLAGCGGKADDSADVTPTPAPTATTDADDSNAADMVLTNGTIITMVSEGDTAEAVAVKNGEIVYVGDAAGAEAFVSDSTEVIDLEGKTVLPGFIDGHIHAPGPYIRLDTELDLMDLGADLEAYKTAVSEFVEANPDFDIYVVNAMDLKAFPNSMPDNTWLDEISSDKPIMCIDVSYHGRLLNSYALGLTGITRDTPNPGGGIIYKDANGELTGYLSDCDDIIGGLPEIEYTQDDYIEAFKLFQQEANSYGITAIDSGGDDIEPATFNQMEKAGELTLRVNNNFFTFPTLGEEKANEVIKYLDDNQQYVSDFLNVRQVKFTVDGVPEGKSSYLLEPYAPEAGEAPDYVSSAASTTEELSAFAAAVNAAGYTVQTHCMGDASVKMAMDAFEYSIEQNGKMDVRNKITHVNLIRDEDVTRMADAGIIAAMQPLWFYYDPFFSPLEEQMFGAERFAAEYHIRDMLDAGVIITGSNDYDVTYDFAPLHAIEAGATQCSPYAGEDQDIETYTRNADQAATVYEMLKMYTCDGAYASFLDDRAGTIEVGKKADLVILGDNPLTCDVKAISDIQVVYTISDGRIVYEG